MKLPANESPSRPCATGDICTGEIVHVLELMGFDTRVDFPALIAAARQLPALVGHDIASSSAPGGDWTATQSTAIQ